MVAYTYYLSDPRVRREAEALTDRGDHVDLICLRKDGENASRIINGVRLYRVAQKRYRGKNLYIYILGYVLFFIRSFMRLTLLYFQHRYDLIHVHTMPDFLIFSACTAKVFGAKLVLDIHDTAPELFTAKFGCSPRHCFVRFVKFLEVFSARFADAVIAVHGPHRDLLMTHGIPDSKISVVMNTADERIFRPRCLRNTLSEEFNLVHHGTIVKRLGLETALKALARVRESIRHVKLSIYGEGDFLEHALELTKELKLESHVHFSKMFVPVEELPRLLEQADIGIVPHVSDCCTAYMLPVKLLEYVAMGIPVIVSKTETVQNFFDDTMVRFFEPGNEVDLATAIFDLYQHPEKRKELARRANKFNVKHNWQQQKRIYYRLVDSLAG